MKKISLPVRERDTDYRTRMRRDIETMNSILLKFATEDGFEEYCAKDTVKLTVGSDTAELCFDPRTWEAAEQFLMFCICHYIESDSLDEYPRYKEMADRYAAALGEQRGTFE